MIDSHLVHLPVLLDETVTALVINVDGFYVDATFGRGGHARAVLVKLSSQGRLLGLDKDPDAVSVAGKLAKKDSRFSIEHCSFADLAVAVTKRFGQSQVDGVLLDIGVSSPQLNTAERGFSFQHDGPLDMRMNPEVGISAAEWLASADIVEIETVIKTFGEERYGKRIAYAIVETREKTPIATTCQLAQIVRKASPSREKNKHPATRTFQAIRIHINNELEELSVALEQALDLLAIGGRLVVISFHSLEDRIVKRFFRKQAKGDDLPSCFPVRADELNPRVRIVSKAIKPSQRELSVNSRARSAVLRVVEKVA